MAAEIIALNERLISALDRIKELEAAPPTVIPQDIEVLRLIKKQFDLKVSEMRRHYREHTEQLQLKIKELEAFQQRQHGIGVSSEDESSSEEETAAETSEPEPDQEPDELEAHQAVQRLMAEAATAEDQAEQARQREQAAARRLLESESGVASTCGQGCKKGWDIRCLCEPNCPAKNSRAQFLRCPQRFNTLVSLFDNDGVFEDSETVEEAADWFESICYEEYDMDVEEELGREALLMLLRDTGHWDEEADDESSSEPETLGQQITYREAKLWMAEDESNVICIRNFSEENDGNYMLDSGAEAVEELELSDENDDEEEGDDPDHVDSKYQFYKPEPDQEPEA